MNDYFIQNKRKQKMKLVVNLLRKKCVIVIRRRMTKHNPSQQILDCYTFIGKRFIMVGTGNIVVFIFFISDFDDKSMTKECYKLKHVVNVM